MSYEAETIIKHAKQIADDLERRLEFWENVSTEEKRDGRELFAGPIFLIVRVCKSLGVSRADLIRYIQNTDAFDAGGKFTREASLLVAPNGRPMAKI